MHTLAQTDLTGLAAVIAAVFAGIATVIGAWNTRTTGKIKAQVDTNGDPRTLGEIQVAAHPLPDDQAPKP